MGKSILFCSYLEAIFVVIFKKTVKLSFKPIPFVSLSISFYLFTLGLETGKAGHGNAMGK